MIVQIEGRLLEATPLEAVIEAHGLGYAVQVPVTTAERLPSVGEKVRLHVHAVYREDSQALYGFWEREERDFFRFLIDKVSGMGPKTALNLFSRLSLTSLRTAIAQNDVALLSQVPGIGKRTAERLCVELKDRVGEVGKAAPTVPGSNLGAAGSPAADAVAALIALGFKPEVADKSVRQALQKLGGEATAEALVKAAFR